MNYVIENNIDFFSEIQKETLNDNDNNNNNICLITRDNLLENYITLECGHKFNYIQLYKEIILQKSRIYNRSMNLMVNQIICPYCRNKQNKLLPYIPIYNNVSKIHGVNSPEIMCMTHRKCKYIIKSGKKKGDYCYCNGFDSKFGTICYRHFKFLEKKLNKENTEEIIIFTDEMNEFNKTHNIKEIKNKLRDKNLKLSGNKKELIMRLFKS